MQEAKNVTFYVASLLLMLYTVDLFLGLVFKAVPICLRLTVINCQVYFLCFLRYLHNLTSILITNMDGKNRKLLYNYIWLLKTKNTVTYPTFKYP